MRIEAVVYLQLVCFNFLGNGPCTAMSLTPPAPLKTHGHNLSTYYVMPDNLTNMFRRAWRARTCHLSLYTCAQMICSSGVMSITGMGSPLCICQLEHCRDSFNPMHVPAGAAYGCMQPYACASWSMSLCHSCHFEPTASPHRYNWQPAVSGP